MSTHDTDFQSADNLTRAAAGGGQRFYGKYRGTVIDNVDLTGQARLLCVVPAFASMTLNWAMPCVPYAGPLVGFHAIPPIGANVWVEFEGGNLDFPIWTGCFWEMAELPLAQELSPEDPSLIKVFRSDFCTLIFNDTPETGGVTLSVIDPAVNVPITMTMTSAGVEINTGIATILMNPEVGITIQTAENTIEMTEGAIAAVAPEVNVTANVSIEGTTEIVGNVSIEGMVEITGNTAITGAMEVTGETNIGGVVTMESECNITGALTVEGGANFLGALAVEGEANFAPLVTVEGDVNILGAGQVEGNWAVLGLIEGVVVPPLI